MRFYVVDDDISIVRILTMIIEEDGNFEVVGSSCNSEDAFNDILLFKPDIVLVDLLMPEMDGNVLVRKLKSLDSSICFIMISQVLDSDLRAESYEAGIEFFINKPINKIEVKKVISKVTERVEMENMLSNIKKMLKTSNKSKKVDKTENENLVKVKHILGMLGMLGEKGTNDIIKVSLYLMKNNRNFVECNLDDLKNYLGDNAQVVKQRIRRAIKVGFTNTANMGIEDYADDTFHTYANTLFDFTNVKAEMDYINHKRKTGGKVSVNKFFEGLVLKCQDE
ncbi:Stage 0 sporulation protein A [Clostridium ljungdahlii DSM 13528]|uniref:Stage 0 sporulation protein A homolog n=1 Tax=Clostridium ljungdahlii (strain ATCC 55383 / DSM 13528 / PETC) TaxID=748727 RepID=D8GNJ7_CLOLD|nr:DNA-binding domain-containing protein [Clostridium ljungdahlii]ADK15860.1 transcriptional regulatory protein [Clostridium ljungdahlii DSM 13528]OAA84270.1 Stage 0 sporulation protein A [Clostridium ljungdahlii DSM 13528]